jgi:hypothetical protein
LDVLLHRLAPYRLGLRGSHRAWLLTLRGVLGGLHELAGMLYQ